MVRSALVALCVLSSMACGPTPGADDASVQDSGVADASMVELRDSGVDAGAADAGIPDASVNDAGPTDAGAHDAGPNDGGAGDAGLLDAGLIDAGVTDAGAVDAGNIAVILASLPDLVICQPGAQPFIDKTEMGADTTYFHACAAVCADWTTCTQETTVRGVTQLELPFVVNEDGQGNGFGGTLRFTKVGAPNHLVFFHKGGSGTDWVDDFLPGKVETAGGIAFQPKWIQQGVGWFARPFAASRLERNLFGVTQRVAAVMKWAYLNVARTPISTMGCSGGSIATYYPRHWHGLDPIMRYQLLSGGPVMSRIGPGCSGGASFLGRCTLDPLHECQTTTDCGSNGGTCTPYEWSGGGVMTAVRATIDHLHANQTSGANDCLLRRAQPAFAVSDFDSSSHPFDADNEHRIDFMMNIGSGASADDGLNVLASGAAVYTRLTGVKSWNPQLSGIHCDTIKTEDAWTLLKVGVGL